MMPSAALRSSSEYADLLPLSPRERGFSFFSGGVYAPHGWFVPEIGIVSALESEAALLQSCTPIVEHDGIYSVSPLLLPLPAKDLTFKKLVDSVLH
jgi:hypothetical protein